MRQEGVVITVRGERALVRLSARGGCEGCCACSSTSGCTQELEAVTTEPVEAGWRVLVEVSSAGAALSALLVFALPLVGLVGGVIVGSRWGGGTAAPLVLGFGALVALFAVAVVVERAVVRPRLPEPRIVDVLNRGS
jgi:positive regulator of sigma E activity